MSISKIQHSFLALLGIAAIALLAFMAALGSGTAQAREVVLQPCSAGAINGYGSLTQSGVNWSVASRCASELTLQSLPSVTTNRESANFVFPVASINHGTFTRVAFSLVGGDGSDGGRSQNIRACTASYVCGTPATTSGPDAQIPEPVVLTHANGGLVQGSDRLQIRGQCSIDPTIACLPGRQLEIRDLSITLEDDKPPVISLDSSFSSSPLPPVVPYEWNGGSREIRVRATDVGVGVRYIAYSIIAPSQTVGPQWYEGSFGCGVGSTLTATIPYLCPQSVKHARVRPFDRSLEVFGIGSGENLVSVTAYDAAGNASTPLEFPVKIDSTKPEFSGLRVTPDTPLNWRSSTHFGFAWENMGTPWEDQHESGVSRAKYRIDPLDPDIGAGFTAWVDEEAISSIEGVNLPGPGRWLLTLTLADKAGNESDVQQIPISVDEESPSSVEVEGLPTIGAGQLMRGFRVGFSRPENAESLRSGLCSYALVVNQEPKTDPGPRGILPGDSDSAPLPAHLPHGANYLHIRAISCSGVAGPVTDIGFEVDAAAPLPLMSSPGSGGWYSPDNPFVLSLGTGDEPGARLKAKLLGTSVSVEGGNELVVPLAAGMNQVEATGYDALGNAATTIVSARYDGEAPIALFKDANPLKPRLVSAVVSDQGSGVIDASIQYRSILGGDWSTFTPLNPTYAGNSGEMLLSAELPDLYLEDGSYELRIVAIDRAGLQTDSRVDSGGIRAVRTVPTRATAAVNAGFVVNEPTPRCKKSRDSNKCVPSGHRKQRLGDMKTVKYGRTANLSGLVLGANGAPIPDARVEVWESVTGSSRKLVSVEQADSSGRFSFSPAPGPSRLIVLNFLGTDTHVPASASVKLLTTAGVTLLVDKIHTRRGWLLRFKGQVLSPPPSSRGTSKAISIQAKLNSDWYTLKGSVGYDALGRYSATARVPSRNRRVRYRFRSVVHGRDGWPYAEGASRTSSLTLR